MGEGQALASRSGCANTWVWVDGSLGGNKAAGQRCLVRGTEGRAPSGLGMSDFDAQFLWGGGGVGKVGKV